MAAVKLAPSRLVVPALKETLFPVPVRGQTCFPHAGVSFPAKRAPI
jgi:hypothetical protein